MSGSLEHFMSCYNVFFKRGDVNKEALFVGADVTLENLKNTVFHEDLAGNGGVGIYQTLVDAFSMQNGKLPITGYNGNYGTTYYQPRIWLYRKKGSRQKKIFVKQNITYTADVPGATVDSIGSDGAVYNHRCAASGTYNMYVNREPRFYLTVMWNRQWYHQASRETEFMSNEMDKGPNS